MPRSSALTPFSVRNFRFQWPADLATSWAFEMEILILGWYVLVETGSVLLLTLYGALLYVGTLIAPMVGVLGDRIGHRILLCGMRAIYAVLAGSLLALALAGALNPLFVFVIAALAGIVRPSDMGVRSALVADSMPAEHLMSAMSISRTTSDSARIAGALTGAGLIAAFGMGPTYAVITVLYALGVLLTARVTPAGHFVTDPAGRLSPWRDLKEGLAYVWSSPRLLAVMWLAFLANLAGFPLSTGLLPYVAREVYHIDQTGLGYLLASFAFGALVGSIALSMAGSNIRLERVTVISSAAWFAVLLVFAQVTSAPAGIVCLVLAGFAQSFSMISLSVVLLRATSPQFRGRIMGVRMLAIYSLPIGLLTAGALIDRVGFAPTATLYAVVGLICTLLIALYWRTDLWRVVKGG